MDEAERARDFVAAGLASLGIEADEAELALIAGVHQVFWPPIEELLALDTTEVEPEPGLDLSTAPR